MDRKALATSVALARRQYGFITWGQALKTGLSPAVIARLVSEGHWRRASRVSGHPRRSTSRFHPSAGLVSPEFACTGAPSPGQGSATAYR